MSDLALALPKDALKEVGDYAILGRLGRGGMGTVYLGVHQRAGTRVAIKVLAEHIVGDKDLTERFLREAQVVNRIGHPVLIDVFAFGELPDGRSYLVMELLEGESLAARIDRAPFAWADLLGVFTQILSGLAAAHAAGVIHRDLKPENIFLLPSAAADQPPRVKIFDFGLAKLPAASMTRTGVALGTPRYMSPEQCRGRDVDHRTDLYAVGMMLYEAVTGRLPFQSAAPLVLLSMQVSASPQPPSRFARIPEALEALILRSIQKLPEQRFENAAQMLEALHAVAPASTQVELTRLAAPAAADVFQQPTAGALGFESTAELSHALFPDEDTAALPREERIDPHALTMPPGGLPAREVTLIRDPRAPEQPRLDDLRPEEASQGGATPHYLERGSQTRVLPGVPSTASGPSGLRVALFVGALVGLLIGTIVAYVSSSSSRDLIPQSAPR